jgi:lysozyme
LAIATLIKIPLSPGQRDALLSFVFNVGEQAFARSTLLSRLDEGKYVVVPDEMRRWAMENGKVRPGLQQLREKEIEL